MKILMVTSELVPFAKSGGLADAVEALSHSLKEAGHDVRIVMPRYYSINKDNLKKFDAPLGVPLGATEEWAAVYETTLPNTKIPVYLLDHERFFGRDGIYGNANETDFSDNPERFAFLSRGSFQLCKLLNFIPDVMHAHDWPSSLVPVYLKYAQAKMGFDKTKSVLTIHNLGYQGSYDKSHFPFFGLDWSLFYGAGFEDHDRINLLKAGLSSADKLTTVSPTYAREIQRPDSGFGLDGLLRQRSHDLVGILNGVNLKEWNPEVDTFIPKQYSAKDLKGKAACKAALQKEFGFREDPNVPLIGMVSRLADQKGISELFGPCFGSAASICIDMNVQFAVLGSGEAWCERELKALSDTLPNFEAKIGYSNKISHLIEAGSDFFMMPSRYEPCGLNQLYSLRYGTLPIARRTGGLADTIENYNQETGSGDGFLLDELTPRSIYDTTGWAVWAYYNKKDHMQKMIQNAMKQDFSWKKSTDEYVRLYKSMME